MQRVIPRHILNCTHKIPHYLLYAIYIRTLYIITYNIIQCTLINSLELYGPSPGGQHILAGVMEDSITSARLCTH